MKRRNPVRSQREKNLELRWFGDIVAEQRKRQGLTQQQLAEASGYTPNYISLLECGDRSPTLTALLRLAAPLGIAASELVRQVESRKANKLKESAR